MDKQANILMPCASMNFQRVDETVPAVKEEPLIVEDFLAEPESDLVTMDGIFSCDKPVRNKCYGTNELSGGLDAVVMKRGEDELDFGILDRFFGEVDDIDDLQGENGLLNPYEDLLDIDLPEVVKLDISPFEGLHFDKSSSESNSPGSCRSSGAFALRETTAQAECYNHMHDQTALCKSHDAPRKNSYPLLPVKRIQTSHSQALDAVENDSDHFASEVTIVERGSDQATKTTVPNRQNRTRKPTRRFIEESSALESRSSRGKQKDTTITLKKKYMKCRSHDGEEDDDEHTKMKALTSIGVSHPQVASEFRPCRGCPKKQTVILEPIANKNISDTESSGTELEDEHLRKKRSTKNRRKRQRVWTLVEVMKLIDGIAQYGVGRWTDIKRGLFLSSPYRTPMDIRDKWRNLLKASCLHKRRQKEVEVERKSALPSSVLHRVAQLAMVHPYPRNSVTKRTRSRPLTAPTDADANEGFQ